MKVCIVELQFRFQIVLLDECGTGVPQYDLFKKIMQVKFMMPIPKRIGFFNSQRYPLSAKDK